MKQENFYQAEKINSGILYLESIITAAQTEKAKLIIDDSFRKHEISMATGPDYDTPKDFHKEIISLIIKRAKDRKKILEAQFAKL